MVGMVPRAHIVQPPSVYKYISNIQKDTYSMVLTGFAMFHAKYLDLYQTKLPKELKDFVDENTNCEDISMNAVIASHLMSEYHLNTPVCPAIRVSYYENLRFLERKTGMQIEMMIIEGPQTRKQ